MISLQKKVPGTHFQELNMLSLIINQKEKSSKAEKKPKKIDLKEELGALDMIIKGEMDSQELLKMARKALEKPESNSVPPNKKFFVEELQSVSFENKKEANQFVNFDKESNIKKENNQIKKLSHQNQKNMELKQDKEKDSEDAPLNSLIADIESLKINNGNTFGFLNLFFDFFDQLKVK